jgi:hypothetical protein
MLERKSDVFERQRKMVVRLRKDDEQKGRRSKKFWKLQRLIMIDLEGNSAPTSDKPA